jgi:hypothetical protein
LYCVNQPIIPTFPNSRPVPDFPPPRTDRAQVHVQLPAAVARVRSIALAHWDESAVYQFRQVG